MYLISKILFGTLSTLSDLDDIECTNQFELLGNGSKGVKRWDLRNAKHQSVVYLRAPKDEVYRRVPKEAGIAIKSEPTGNKNDKLPESPATCGNDLHNSHDELGGEGKGIIDFLMSPDKRLPNGYSMVAQECCPPTTKLPIGIFGIKEKANFALCQTHKQLQIYPESPEQQKSPGSFTSPMFVNWTNQAADDAAVLDLFASYPDDSGDEILPTGYFASDRPCCEKEKKFSVMIPEGERQGLTIALCPKDKQFHIYRKNIYGRHAVWDCSKKTGSDLTETTRPSRSKTPSRNRSSSRDGSSSRSGSRSSSRSGSRSSSSRRPL